MKHMETKTFTITARPGVMRRFERFLALLHWNSRYGHSGVFAMSLDGDGEERFTADPQPEHRADVQAIGSYGYDVETANSDSYFGQFKDWGRVPKWYAQNGRLIDWSVKQ